LGCSSTLDGLRSFSSTAPSRSIITASTPAEVALRTTPFATRKLAIHTTSVAFSAEAKDDETVTEPIMPVEDPEDGSLGGSQDPEVKEICDKVS